MSITWTNFSAGFGDSSGNPTSDRSIVSDAEAIYRWILERRKSAAVNTHLERDGQELKTADSGARPQGATGSPIILWGQSFGTGFV